MATVAFSAAGPPPPPPPPPPPNWKPTDRPYLANYAKTKQRKKDEKAQVDTDNISRRRPRTMPQSPRYGVYYTRRETHQMLLPSVGRAAAKWAAALETAERSSTHQQSSVDPVSGEAGKNVEAESTEPAVEESQGQGRWEDGGD